MTTDELIAAANNKTVDRAQMAMLYRFSINASLGGEIVSWPAVNTAIINRWSRSGLKWIKRQAWGNAEARP